MMEIHGYVFNKYHSFYFPKLLIDEQCIQRVEEWNYNNNGSYYWPVRVFESVNGELI